MGRTFGLFGKIWLNNFVKPVEERVLMKYLLEHDVERLLEIGVGTLERTERPLGTGSSRPVRYVGIDPFESRLPSDPPGVSLKEAHRRLTKQAQVQLVPGPVDATLARVCNHIGVFDMAIVASGLDDRSLERVWFFVRRLVRPTSAVFRQTAEGKWTQLSRDELDAKSRQILGRQAA